MIATLKKNKDGDYYCSECMMRQLVIGSICSFCECEFSNYEQVMVEILHSLTEKWREDNESKSTIHSGN